MSGLGLNIGGLEISNGVDEKIEINNNAFAKEGAAILSDAERIAKAKADLAKRQLLAPKKTKAMYNQHFQQIETAHFESGTLFVDDTFPANQSSIGVDMGAEVVWMRPHEIVKHLPEEYQKPEFEVDGASRYDINQGRLGNCWLMAGIACLTENDKLFDKVVDPDQGFTPDTHYAGIFRFRFWRFGDWVEVCVDDLLPTINNQLIFLQSQGKSRNEFWPALFEKAYAKLHGNYNNLRGGQPIVAMRDFTGGVTETYNLKKLPENLHVGLHTLITQALRKGALIGCGINPISGKPGESTLSCGLIAGHAYSITNAVKIRGIPLVRVRNPHGGRGVEWNGAWSDDCRFQIISKKAKIPDGWALVNETVIENNLLAVLRTAKEAEVLEKVMELESGCCMLGGDPEDAGFTKWASCEFRGDSFCFGEHEGDNIEKQFLYIRGSDEWRNLSEEDKKEMDLCLEQDGEFWMSWDDFKKYFDDVQFCNLSAENLDDDDDDGIAWKLQQLHGRWVKGVNAGGCLNNRNTFHLNPQIIVNLTDCETDVDDRASCLIAIMHKEMTIVDGQQKTFQTYSRGVSIFPCEGTDEEILRSGKPLPKERFKRNPVAKVPFTNAREGSKRILLPPGPYILVPCTFKADQEGDFLLRIFTEMDRKEDEEDDLEADDEEFQEALMVNNGFITS